MSTGSVHQRLLTLSKSEPGSDIAMKYTLWTSTVAENMISWKNVSINVAFTRCCQSASDHTFRQRCIVYVQVQKIAFASIFPTIVDRSNQSAETIIIMIRSQYMQIDDKAGHDSSKSFILLIFDHRCPLSGTIMQPFLGAPLYPVLYFEWCRIEFILI